MINQLCTSTFALLLDLSVAAGFSSSESCVSGEVLTDSMVCWWPFEVELVSGGV